MAVVATKSNHAKYQEMKKNIDYSVDTFKMVFMNSAFAFDKDSHATYADISANEIANGNGYTTGGIAMTGGALSEDDANDRGEATWDDVTLTASGGDVGPTGSACIIDDTTPDDTVIGCIDFGTDYTVPDGASLQLQDPTIRNS